MDPCGNGLHDTAVTNSGCPWINTSPCVGQKGGDGHHGPTWIMLLSYPSLVGPPQTPPLKIN